MISIAHDPFETLGIVPDLPAREVRRNCDRLRVELLIARNTEVLDEVEKACRVLGDPSQRARAMFWTYLLSETRAVDRSSSRAIKRHLSWLAATVGQSTSATMLAVHDAALLATEAFRANPGSVMLLQQVLANWHRLGSEDRFWDAFRDQVGVADPLLDAEVARIRESIYEAALERIRPAFDGFVPGAERTALLVQTIWQSDWPPDQQAALALRATRDSRRQAEEALKQLSGRVQSVRSQTLTSRDELCVLVSNIACNEAAEVARLVLAYQALDPDHVDPALGDSLARALDGLAWDAHEVTGQSGLAIGLASEAIRAARSPSVEIELGAHRSELLFEFHIDAIESHLQRKDFVGAAAHAELAAASASREQDRQDGIDLAKRLRSRVGSAGLPQVDRRKIDIARDLNGPTSTLATRCSPEPRPPGSRSQEAEQDASQSPWALISPTQETSPNGRIGTYSSIRTLASTGVLRRAWPFLLLVGLLVIRSLASGQDSSRHTGTSGSAPFGAVQDGQPLAPQSGIIIPSDDGGWTDYDPGSVQANLTGGEARIFTYSHSETRGQDFTLEAKVVNSIGTGSTLLVLQDAGNPSMQWLVAFGSRQAVVYQSNGDTFHESIRIDNVGVLSADAVHAIKIVYQHGYGTLYLNGQRFSYDGAIQFAFDPRTSWNVGFGAMYEEVPQALFTWFSVEFDSVSLRFGSG